MIAPRFFELDVLVEDDPPVEDELLAPATGTEVEVVRVLEPPECCVTTEVRIRTLVLSEAAEAFWLPVEVVTRVTERKVGEVLLEDVEEDDEAKDEAEEAAAEADGELEDDPAALVD